MAIQDGDLALPHFLFQALRDQPGSNRAGGGSPFCRIIVAAVSDILPILISRERNSTLRQIVKGLSGHGRLHQRHISVHRATCAEIFGHFPRAVHLPSTDGDLVVRLFISADVTRSSGIRFFGQDCDILLSHIPQLLGRVVSRGARPHNHSVNGIYFSRNPVQNNRITCHCPHL